MSKSTRKYCPYPRLSSWNSYAPAVQAELSTFHVCSSVGLLQAASVHTSTRPAQTMLASALRSLTLQISYCSTRLAMILKSIGNVPGAEL